MSSKQKGRSCVQGGWAEQTNQNNPEPTRVTAQTTTKKYIYQDPKQKPMPGLRPANFSWIIEGVLSGSSFPYHPGHFHFYMSQGIRHVVTLTEFKPPLSVAPAGMSHLFLPVVEFEAPSLTQIQQFVKYVDDARDKKEGVVAHCHWGRGRTGVMLAAYWMKDQNITPQCAIDYVRNKRPYSVETYEQEDAVIEYCASLKQQPPDATD